MVRSAGARGSRPGSDCAAGRRRSARARPRRSSTATPARRRPVTRIASACGPSSSSGRLRCSRTPRSTCATASMPEALHDVDEQSELDAPALDERQRLEQRAPPGVLAGERLHDVGELGEQRREQRAGDELGDAPAAGRRHRATAGGSTPFTSTTSGSVSSGSTSRVTKCGAEVADVGVEPAHEVAAARVQRLPQRVALARSARELGEDRRRRRRRVRPPSAALRRWRRSSRRR